ncbi:MAG TPA: hypothetical protein VJN88_07290 [Ktedonobacterales bacterium]|nr:hypothetical protein [Ktedonobacterales bacterium]
MLVAGAVILVALAVFLLPDSPLAVSRLDTSLTPTVTIGPRDRTFYMVHAVPWGTLTIDGKVTAAIQNGSDYSSVTLPAGTHTFVYNAAPFPVVRCQITIPNNGNNTCPLDHNAYDAPNASIPSTQLMDLRATIANLSLGELSALTTKIESSLGTLGGRTQLRAGDHYADATGNTRLAAGSMQAIVSYNLSTNTQPGQGCAAICDSYGMGAGPSGPAWLIAANVTESWRCLIANGQAIAGPRIGQNSYPLQLVFAVTWDGSWHITSLDDGGSMGCQSANAMFNQDISPVNPTFSQMTTRATASSPRNSAADGCVIALTPYDNAGTPSGNIAYFLYRCGSLMAVNAAAQTILPGIPSLSANEAQIAQQMIATMPPQ